MFNGCIWLAGSRLHGVANEQSDIDLVGFCFPPAEQVYQHNRLLSFTPDPPYFECLHEHHVDIDGESVDVNIYSFNRFMALCLKGSPNVTELLFAKPTVFNPICQPVLDARKQFLTRPFFNSLSNWAGNLMKKANQESSVNPSRVGQMYISKPAVQTAVLADYIYQILTENDLTLDRHSKTTHLMAANRGGYLDRDEYVDLSTVDFPLDVDFTAQIAALPEPDFEVVEKLVRYINNSFYSEINDEI